MSKTKMVFDWVNENIGKAHFTKEQKITKVGLSTNKTTKDSEVKETSSVSFSTDGGNMISITDEWIDQIALAKDKQSMIVMLTDDCPLKRDIDIKWFNDEEGLIMLSNDTSRYDIDEDDIEEGIEEIETSKKWPKKVVKTSSGEEAEVPIVRLVGNEVVSNYIKAHKHTNLVITYLNDDYRFDVNELDALDKNSLSKKCERLYVLQEDDKEWNDEPTLVLSDKEEVREVMPSWAKNHDKPSILAVKGADNDRFLIFPCVDYPIGIMATLTEIDSQFENIFNSEPISTEVGGGNYFKLHNECMDMLVGAIKSNPKCYDGEKDTRNILESEATKLEERAKQIREGLPDTPIDKGDTRLEGLKAVITNFVDSREKKIEKEKKESDELIKFNGIKGNKEVVFLTSDEKAKEFVDKLKEESENFARKVHGDEAVDATLKCIGAGFCNDDTNDVTPQSKLKTLVSDFIKDKKIVLGEEMADDEDKEEIAECIADGGACLEEAEDKLGELCKALAERIKDSGIGAVHFYNDGDKVSCDVTLHFEY